MKIFIFFSLVTNIMLFLLFIDNQRKNSKLNNRIKQLNKEKINAPHLSLATIEHEIMLAIRTRDFEKYKKYYKTYYYRLSELNK